MKFLHYPATSPGNPSATTKQQQSIALAFYNHSVTHRGVKPIFHAYYLSQTAGGEFDPGGSDCLPVQPLPLTPDQHVRGYL